MKIIYTNKNEEILVDDEDYDFLSQWTWRIVARGYAGRTSYVKSTKSRVSIEYMHRRILGLERGVRLCVDHINGNRLDNRRENLRICTNSQNGFNRGTTVQNKSGYKGVIQEKKTGKWRAAIRANGKVKHLGTFDDPASAHAAYCKAGEELHGPFFRST